MTNPPAPSDERLGELTKASPSSAEPSRSNEGLGDITAKLTKAQLAVIMSLGHFDDYGYKSFKHLGSCLGISRDRARELLKSMPSEWFVFSTGLTTDDGDFYGSGYALSAVGCEIQDKISEHQDTLDAAHLDQSL